MKAYTDVNQSKKLAEILPIKTADMCYMEYATSDDPTFRYEGQQPMVLGDMPITEVAVACIPCWSLAALLEQIPSDLGSAPLTIKKDDSERLKYWLNYHDRWEREDDIQTKSYDNLVDACYEMIIKLKRI